MSNTAAPESNSIRWLDEQNVELRLQLVINAPQLRTADVVEFEASADQQVLFVVDADTKAWTQDFEPGDPATLWLTPGETTVRSLSKLLASLHAVPHDGEDQDPPP